MSKMRFSKRKLHFLFFSFFMLEIEKQKRQKKKKREKAKKPDKNRVFLRWSSKNMKNQKKGILPDTICVRKGEKKRIFVHTICFGQKFFLDQNSVKQEKL